MLAQQFQTDISAKTFKSPPTLSKPSDPWKNFPSTAFGQPNFGILAVLVRSELSGVAKNPQAVHASFYDGASFSRIVFLP